MTTMDDKATTEIQPDLHERIKSIGVIGAGQMGNGIAHVSALTGYTVYLNDLDEARFQSAIDVMRKNMTRQVKRGGISEDDMNAALGRISFAPDYGHFKDADLIIEAATENQDLKQKIFQGLRDHVKPSAILASNTSSISITWLGAQTEHPNQFIGIHFMNPVPVMQMIELIRGIATDAQTFEITKQFAASLGKTIAVAEDFPGFIINRIFVPMLNEAVFTLHEGIGDVESIDKAMKLGLNHPMGPLELADFIGLDTCLSVMHVLYDGFADSKYRPCPLLIKYVEAGWLGRKTGRGFYDYRGGTPVPAR